MSDTAELALIPNHAVDEGIHRGPVTCLHLGDKTWEHFTDVPLVLRTHRGGEFIGGTIPSDDSILLMGKQAHGLPTVGQQDITCQYLLYAEAVVGLYHLPGSKRHG